MTSDLRDSKANAVVQANDCKSVPPNQVLECSANLLRLSQQELNDPGTLIDQKILASDIYCMSVEQTWEFGGANVKKEFRSHRTFTFPVCHYKDFWDRLQSNFLFGGIGVMAGLGSGIWIAK